MEHLGVECKCGQLSKDRVAVESEDTVERERVGEDINKLLCHLLERMRRPSRHLSWANG